MKEKLIQSIEKIKSDQNIESYSEDMIKQSVVLRLISILGWDIYDVNEVYPEYPIEGTKLDYSLIVGNVNKYFIEVKRAKEDLSQHEQQLVGYFSKHGVRLATLTNGLTWWFYLPLTEGTWKNKKFYTIDLTEQDVGDVAERFVQLLSKQNIESSHSAKVAEELLKSRRTKEVIVKTLPEAWNRVISEPDELVVDIVIETVEKLCGHKPSQNTVLRFLFDHKKQFLIVEEKAEGGVRRGEKRPIVKPKGNRIPRVRVSKMILDKMEYNLRFPSVEILVNTAEWLITNGELSAKNCPIKTSNRSKRNLVHTIPNHDHRGFLNGKQLSNGLWIECHNSTKQAVDLALGLLRHFGHSPPIIKFIE
ncbi:MAG: hypothetical protein V3T99_05815 [Nitrososphaerales archaeon]